MVLFWRNLAAGMAFLLASSGCRGQDVSGRWRGPFPLPGAVDCSISLKPDHVFDLSCGDHSWVGLGRYTRNGDRLLFEFQSLAHTWNVVRRPSPVELKFEGRGNSLELPEGVVWRRSFGR